LVNESPVEDQQALRTRNLKVRTGLIALGAFLGLSQATNAADLMLRPRPMQRPATESRTAPPQQQMLFDEFLRWLRQRR
jgi:hypothetical protein